MKDVVVKKHFLKMKDGAVADDKRIKGSCMIILEETDPGTFDRGTPTKKLVHQLSSTNDPVFNLKVPAPSWDSCCGCAKLSIEDSGFLVRDSGLRLFSHESNREPENSLPRTNRRSSVSEVRGSHGRD
jgi:hypothetical protein